MRPFLITYFCISLFLLGLGGCVTLPRFVAVPEHEEKAVADSFHATVTRHQKCDCCVDANLTVTFNSLLQSGAVSGYFQGKSPSYMKFVGENPFGQPLLIFTTNGKEFSYISVFDQKVYEGDVTGATYQKYAPNGFDAEHGFYWLTGKLRPGPFKIHAIGRQKDGNNYWIKLSWEDHAISSLILYDQAEGLIRRHMLVDNNDKTLLDIQYSNYEKIETGETEKRCRLPGEVMVKSSDRHATLALRFRDWGGNPDFPEEDFAPFFPAGFEKIEVQ